MKIQTAFATLIAFALAISSAHADDATRGSVWIGTVTHCGANSVLQRGTNQYRIGRGAGLQSGDMITTKPGQTLSLALKNGPVINVAGDSELGIAWNDGSWRLSSVKGESRIVHDGQSKAILETGGQAVRLGRSIVQNKADSHRAMIKVDAGRVEVQTNAGFQQVRRGQVFRTDTRQVGDADLISGWSLNGSQVRLAAAVQNSPRLEPPVRPANPRDPQSASRSTSETASAGEANSSDEMPLTDPNAVANEDPFDDEDDDELPRLAVDPAPAADPTPTRAGTDPDAGLTVADSGLSSSVGTSSLSLGSFFGGGVGLARLAGSANNDANQQTFQGILVNGGGSFPGAIHLLTAQSLYPFTNVELQNGEINNLFGGSTNKYFSIGEGTAPTTQVVTNFFTGTSVNPNTVEIPRFGQYLIELDDFNYPDPANGGSGGVAITGLTGTTPTSPTIIGATPLEDDRSPTRQLNSQATFALGEFLVQQQGADGIAFAVRRSDQDRLIVKDPGGNDANDLVTKNDDVQFSDEVDPRFLPQSPTVKEPIANTFDQTGTAFSELQLQRRAAFTTLVADQLTEFSRRTNQTRFVVDGKIVDISGFKPQ